MMDDLVRDAEDCARDRDRCTKEAAAYIHRLSTAITQRDAVIRELVEALERSGTLIKLLTVRQVFEASVDAIEAAGMNPWGMNEGIASCAEKIRPYFIDAALARAKEMMG